MAAMPGLAVVGFMVLAGRTFGTEEFAGDVESFAADDDNLLAIEQLFGHYTGQTTQKMSLAIDNDLMRMRWLATGLGLNSWPRQSHCRGSEGVGTYDWLEARHLARSWSTVVVMLLELLAKAALRG